MPFLAALFGLVASGVSIYQGINQIINGNKAQAITDQQIADAKKASQIADAKKASQDQAAIASAQTQTSIDEAQQKLDFLNLVTSDYSSLSAANQAELKTYFDQYGLTIDTTKSIFQQSYEAEAQPLLNDQTSINALIDKDGNLLATGSLGLKQDATKASVTANGLAVTELGATRVATEAQQSVDTATTYLKGRDDYLAVMDAVGVANVSAAARGQAGGATSAGEVAGERVFTAKSRFGEAMQIDTTAGLFGASFGAMLKEQTATMEGLDTKAEELKAQGISLQGDLASIEEQRKKLVGDRTTVSYKLAELAAAEFSQVKENDGQKTVLTSAIEKLKEVKTIYDNIVSPPPPKWQTDGWASEADWKRAGSPSGKFADWSAQDANKWYGLGWSSAADWESKGKPDMTPAAYAKSQAKPQAQQQAATSSSTSAPGSAYRSSLTPAQFVDSITKPLTDIGNAIEKGVSDWYYGTPATSAGGSAVTALPESAVTVPGVATYIPEAAK